MSDQHVEPLVNQAALEEDEARVSAMIKLIATGEAVLIIGAACSTRLGCPGPRLINRIRSENRNVAGFGSRS